MFRWRGVRVRTVAVALIIVAAALGIASLAFVTTMRSQLLQAVDLSISQRALDVAAATRTGALGHPLPVARGGSTFVQLVGSSGAVIDASADLTGEPPVALFPVPVDRVTLKTIRDAPLGDQGSFRVAGTAVAGPNRTLRIYAGTSLAPLEASISSAVQLLAVGVPVLLIVVGVLTWLLVGRALASVERIRADVAAIGPEDIAARVSEPGTGDELSRLAATMNNMLDRLEQATRRQREFVADASHELRTPLAAANAQLEVGLAYRDGTTLGVAVTAALDDLQRMSEIVENLLFLARGSDAPPTGAPWQTVDIDDVMAQELSRIRRRGLPVKVHATIEPVQIQGNAELLRRMTANLLDNAARYARSRVDAGIHTSGNTVIIWVGDDGPGVPVEDRERIFERFSRLDSSRSRSDGGSGLGLAIVRQVATLHRGQVTVEENHPGARFVVTLPSTFSTLPSTQAAGASGP